MAVQTIVPSDFALVAGGNTFRGPSEIIWADCPITAIQEDITMGGMLSKDDFTTTGSAFASGAAFKGSSGQWAVYMDTGGFAIDGGLEGGKLSISSGTDLDQQVFFAGAGSYRMVTTSTLALNRKLWFEARVAKSSIASDILEFFVGLADTQLTAAGLPAVNKLFSGTDDTLATAPNIFGFHGKGDTNPADVAVAFNLAGGTVNYPTNLTTVVNTATGANMVAQSGETGFVKLGFIFDPNAIVASVTSATARQTVGQAKKKLVRFFVNGIELPTFLTSQDVQNATAGQAFPTGFMSPIFGCAQHATKGNFLIDWIQVAQLPNS